VIELGLLGTKTRFDVAETFPKAKGSLGNNLSRFNPMRMDLVVPFTVELVPFQADLGEFLVVDLGSGWVGPVIELGMHF
jgi:hypothetical protein